MNGPAVGDRPWLWGTTVVMLSTVDGPPGPSVTAVHSLGDHPWLPHLVWGTDCGGTIGSVTELSVSYYS